jgi:hypothetical protein
MPLAVLILAATAVSAEPPLVAVRQEPRAVDVAARIIERVPPLQSPRGRWPLILWQAGPFTPQSRATYEALLARGVTQHVQLDIAHIPLALAVQAAGSPVIVMEGQGGRWPATLAGDIALWGHRFDPGYKPPRTIHPCLMWLDGWAAAGKRVRDTLRAFKQAGVIVDAVWMDWEGDPMSDWRAHEQARNCERCRRTVPPRAMASPEAFRQWRGQYWMDLLGAYLGAPVKEVYPSAEVTNWMVNVSTPEAPVRHWDDRPLPPAVPSMMTATNTVAYGHTDFFKAAWKPEWPLDREHVDQLYTHLLLRMASDDARNRAIWAPGLKSFPWVARWVDETKEKDRPILSRERYREVLRHLWLRGIDGMQVYNAVVPGHEDMALAEVEDALTVYAEMNALGELLGGEPMNLEVPPPQSDAAMWSGRRRVDRAIVRAFKPGGGEAAVRVEAWPGHVVTLIADGAGRTYRLRLEQAGVEVEAIPPR